MPYFSIHFLFFIFQCLESNLVPKSPGIARPCCGVPRRWDLPILWRQRWGFNSVSRVGLVSRWKTLQCFVCVFIIFYLNVIVSVLRFVGVLLVPKSFLRQNGEENRISTARCSLEFAIRSGLIGGVDHLWWMWPVYLPVWWLLELWCDDLCHDLRRVAFHHQDLWSDYLNYHFSSLYRRWSQQWSRCIFPGAKISSQSDTRRWFRTSRPPDPGNTLPRRPRVWAKLAESGRRFEKRMEFWAQVRALVEGLLNINASTRQRVWLISGAEIKFKANHRFWQRQDLSRCILNYLNGSNIFMPQKQFATFAVMVSFPVSGLLTWTVHTINGFQAFRRSATRRWEK